MSHGQTDDSSVEPIRIGAEHPQYAAVVNKRFNRCFTARPDYVRLAASTEHVLAAVQEAVNEQRRLVVTSGGHCLEGFVSDPDVRVIIDVSPMKRIHYDPERRAVAVEAGATVGETYQANYPRLQRIKARWDPLNVFRHALSIRIGDQASEAAPKVTTAQQA